VITVGTGLGRLVSKVRSWQFSRQLAKAERRQLSIDIIAKPVGVSAKLGMMALLGHLNNNKHTHKDWTK
jgi:hypothetical protein